MTQPALIQQSSPIDDVVADLDGGFDAGARADLHVFAERRGLRDRRGRMNLRLVRRDLERAQFLEDEERANEIETR